MLSNAFLSIMIFGSLFVLICLLCIIVKFKDALFMKEIFDDIQKMNERFWMTYPETRENRLQLIKEIRKYLKEIAFLNPGLTFYAKPEGKDVRIMVELRTMWCLRSVTLKSVEE